MAKKPAITLPSSKVNIDITPGAVEPGMKSAGATSAKMFMVPVENVREIDGFNVRVNSPDYQAHVANLAEMIRVNGFDRTKPISGYVGKDGDANVIYVTDGHTRLAAVKMLNANDSDVTIDKVPVVVHAADISMDSLTERLHTANSGRPLTPFELGVVVKRLMKVEGADKTATAGRLGVTSRYLDDVLLLVNAPKIVREAVLDGTVSSTMAIQQLRKAGDNPEKAAEAISAATTKAKAAGKTKATAKDVGIKMQKLRATVSVGAGTDMKDIVKAVAAHVRSAIAAIAHATDPEAKVADVDGTINLVIEVPAPVAEPKAAPAKKAAAKPAAKTKAEPAAKAEATSKPKGKAKAKAAPVEEAAEDDLEVEGAEAVTDEGIDDEPAMAPPAVPNGEGVGSDEDPDI